MSDLHWLQALIAQEGAVAGSVHRLVADHLQATAFQGIPADVQAVTASIPLGKGMAGLAWQRRAPVSTCNLATDPSDDIRPGARTVDARAAVALPVFDAAGEVRAVVGLAFATDAALDDAALQRAAAELPEGAATGRVVIVAYRPKPGRAAELAALMPIHVPTLRALGLATDRLPITMQAADGTVIEVFEWASADAIARAHEHPEVQALWARYAAVCDYVPVADVPGSRALFSEFSPLG